MHVLTNHGIFLFHFKYSLIDPYELYPYYGKILEPIAVRVIRHQFNNFNKEIATNLYGYAFLLTKYTSTNDFETYLGAVSFYSARNSKLFKLIKVSEN